MVEMEACTADKKVCKTASFNFPNKFHDILFSFTSFKTTDQGSLFMFLIIPKSQKIAITSKLLLFELLYICTSGEVDGARFLAVDAQAFLFYWRPNGCCILEKGRQPHHGVGTTRCLILHVTGLFV